MNDRNFLSFNFFVRLNLRFEKRGWRPAALVECAGALCNIVVQLFQAFILGYRMTSTLGRLVAALFIAHLLPCMARTAEPIAVQLASDMTLSPDGKTLVFAWDNDLWSVSTEGGRATQLTTDSSKDSQPKFSPDGQRLAFVSDRTGSDQIFVMPIAGGLPEQKTHHSEGYALPIGIPTARVSWQSRSAIIFGEALSACCA